MAISNPNFQTELGFESLSHSQISRTLHRIDPAILEELFLFLLAGRFRSTGIRFLWTPIRKYPKGKKGCLNFTETRGEVREMNMSLNMTRRHNAINVMALCLRVHYDRIVTGALVFGGIYRSVEWVLHGDGRGLHFELFGFGPVRAHVFQNHPIY